MISVAAGKPIGLSSWRYRRCSARLFTPTVSL